MKLGKWFALDLTEKFCNFYCKLICIWFYGIFCFNNGKFVKLNTAAWFAFDWTEKFWNLFTANWFAGKISMIEYCDFIFFFSMNEKFVKLNAATWFAFDLTENFVKLNTAAWFASDLTENSYNWILCSFIFLSMNGKFVKLDAATWFAFDLTEKFMEVNTAT